MHEAAQVLVGHHDFSTFRDAECQAENPVRTLDRLDVRREGDEIHIHASARAFLHRQVRSMVGSLEHVGSGKWRADDLLAALKSCERARCGQVAPPEGLLFDRRGLLNRPSPFETAAVGGFLRVRVLLTIPPSRPDTLPTNWSAAYSRHSLRP